MKRRRLAFGGSMCACQPLGNPRSPALFGQRMGKARDEGRLFGTDRPLPGSLPRVSLRRLATRKMLPEAAVPVLETLREHNPQLSQENAGPPQVSLTPTGSPALGALSSS